MYLFKDNKVYEYTGQRENLSQEKFLDYLSSDNYLRLSEVAFDNADEFIKNVLGIAGSFVDRMYSNYGQQIENYFTELAKQYFKKVYLGHWDINVQVGLTCLVLVTPVLFFITVAFSQVIILLYNQVCKYMFERNIQKLEERK